MQKDLLLPPWPEDRDGGEIFCEVSTVGVFGVVCGTGIWLGSLGRLDTWGGGDGVDKIGGGG